ncbi:MAG: T9SS type A sorting domain-containing protein, partial [Flavobacteriales bacterium]|nr:T9SS type A sorting domain-containing protein [Flavobacteriales bacterium]
LRQVDLDGTIKHSQTVVGFLDREQSPVHLFPNPAQDKLNVIFNSAMEGTAVVTLTDASGRPVLRHGTTAHRGQCNTAIQLDQISNGLYAVDITLPDGSAIRGHRFLKR